MPAIGKIAHSDRENFPIAGKSSTSQLPDFDATPVGRQFAYLAHRLLSRSHSMEGFQRNSGPRDSSAGLHERAPRHRRYRTVLLTLSMLATIWTVALLVYEDIKRRSAESLSDFARDQATLAQCLAQNLRERLAAREQESAWPGERSELWEGLRAFERTGERLVLFQLSPSTPAAFLSPTGEPVLSDRRLHIAPRPEGGTCAAMTLPLLPEDFYAPSIKPAHPGG